MKIILKTLTSCALLVSMLATPAYADRDDHRGHHRGHHKKHGWHDDWHHDRGHHRGRHRDRYRVYYPYYNDVVVYHPPVHRTHYYSSNSYYNDATYSTVRCTNRSNPLGLILGGAAGGILGHQIGKGHGKTAATIGGAVLGAGIGSSVSQYCNEEVFRTVPLGTPVVWQSPNQYENYYVTATREYQNGGRYCREYQALATVGGRQQQTYGTACMQPDGSWEIVN